MSTTPLRLNDLLGLTELPSNGLAWHDRIVAGFETSSARALASHLGVDESDVLELVNASGKEDKLGPRASNFLYRIAKSLRELLVVNGNDIEKASLWLRTENAELRGRVPILLLASQVGFDYVTMAVGRMKPAPKPVEMSPAPSPEEDDEDEADDYE